MGQQQLLLLVLGIVIVGLAVVVGIQAFGENQKKANSDAIVNDAIRIASDAQAWRLKPAAFGGGAGNAAAAPFTGITLTQLGYNVTGTDYRNLNGRYRFSGTPGANLVIVGESLGGSNNDNRVTATVTGTNPEQISTAVATADDAGFGT
jgi:hypothetical protein